MLLFALLVGYTKRYHWSFLQRNVFNVVINTSGQEGVPKSPKIWAIAPNSGGLRLDAAIYEEYLGADLSLLQDPPPKNSNDLDKCIYLFLEVTPNHPTALMHEEWKTPGDASLSTEKQCRQMLMVNTDQFYNQNLGLRDLELLLCKTRQCVFWVQKLQEEKLKQEPTFRRIPILYTGFTSFAPPSPSPTLQQNTMDRFTKILHVAGSSPHKGSWNILQAWIGNPQWPTLTITSYDNKLIDVVLLQLRQSLGLSKLPDNIHHISYKLSKEEMSQLMHSHGVHLCLSGMEGFGHYMNEARAVGAMVVTPNYPSMNEMITANTGVLVEPSNMLRWTNGLPFANVEPVAVALLMNSVILPMPLEQRAALGKGAKESFLEDKRKFKTRMQQFQCYLQSCFLRGDGTSEACAKECGLDLE